ncbi:MAG: ABC transporter permease [Bacteroidetes bacterium]|nr:ABC transporter permease [Bacteroidota bacterium]
MLVLKLAFRNITHAGLRTWLNVIVLSFAFVLIVLTEGLYDGMSEQVKDAEIDSSVGGGQFWQKDYDPNDPFSFETAHSEIPVDLKKEIERDNASAVLIASASIFPRNLIQSVTLKGIDPDQKIVNLPVTVLKEEQDTNAIPGLIGFRMAKSTGLQAGDYVSARWRNIKGTFDAGDIKIVKVININIPSVDKGQIWIPLESLRTMMQAPGQATVITFKKNLSRIPSGSREWIFKDHNYLLKDLNENISRKRLYSNFMFSLLLGIALLAVFDTQVLSIFRRRKEIGTLMALGMTKWSVIILFTLEGCLLGILAFITGFMYGYPILAYLAKEGIVLPRMIEQSQFAILLVLYPKYGLKLYIVTALILFISVIIVSFLPAHRIAKLKPTDALKGKLS